MPQSRSGYPLILLAAVLWGLIGVIAQGILEAGVGPIEIAFWRAALGGGLFVAHAAWIRRLRLEPTDVSGRLRDAFALVLFGLVGVTLFYASLNLAIDRGGISLAFILLYTAPAFVAVFARLLLGEALGARKLALVGVAMAGVALVASDRGSGIQVSAASVAWGLAAGASYASYYLFGKWILGRYRPVTIYAFVLPVGALGLLPLVDFAPKTPTAWALLAVLAVVSTYVAYLAYFTGLQHVEASRAVLVATIEPVVAAVLAAWVFGERFGAAGVGGSALVLVAAALSSVRRAGRPAP